jgi:PAS domain S-box-containing protein
MASVPKPDRPEAAPALYRLLTDSALSRAALGACGIPLAILDARIPARSLTYVNPAFESFFGYRASDALGHPLAKLLFKNDEPLVHRLLAEPGSHWSLRAHAKDGSQRHVDVSLGAVHSAAGELTHWVVAFSDRSEVEKLRAELDGVKSAAAAS